MNLEQFRVQSLNIIDYVINFKKKISGKSPNSDVPKTHLEYVIPETAPSKGEPLERILDDLEKYITPRLNQLQPLGFHALEQRDSSYTNMLAEMLKVTFDWNMCASGKELESTALDWYAKIIGLPEIFLHRAGNGGCVIQGTVGENIATCMIAALQTFFNQISRSRFTISRPFVVASLVAYCTKEAKDKIQEAILLCMVNLRTLDTDGNFCLRADTLSKAIEEDKVIGFIPFFVSITLGNVIGTCDSLDEIGIVCEKHELWLNVDASFAGNTLVCPEYRHYIRGIEYATSFNVNPCEWLMIHPDSVLLFVTDLEKISNYIVTDRRRFNYGYPEEDWIFDNKKSSLAYQLWISIRSYGADGLKKHVRNRIQQAELFKRYISKDNRFSILNCNFGKVYFRLKGSNDVNETFLRTINASGKLYLNRIVLEEILIILFSACAESDCEDYIKATWNTIKEVANEVLDVE